MLHVPKSICLLLHCGSHLERVEVFAGVTTLVRQIRELMNVHPVQLARVQAPDET